MTRVDLRASYERGPYLFALWGRNVFDERGIAGQVTDISLFIQPLGSGATTGYMTYTAPREYGATLSYRFQLFTYAVVDVQACKFLIIP